MPYSGKIISAAKARLAAQADERRMQTRRKLEQVYSAIPEIEKIDRELREMMSGLALEAFKSGPDSAAQISRMRAHNLALQVRREDLLLNKGFSPYYTDDTPLCARCGDRGFVGAKMCDCLAKLCAEEQKKALSCLLRLGNESFDNFRLDYYDSEADPDYGVSPRDNMELVFENCVEYVRRFGKDSGNLCFRGGTGLGKTFLSACIAREVAENGHSVVYDTAISIFDIFEKVKFGGGDEAAEEVIDSIMGCDLLIIDDLGTEMKTQFTISALYSIINTRLMRDNKTIITTNLSMSAMKERYTPQIMSRIEGEYTTLFFFGSDIRIQKKNEPPSFRR